jgi:hypothetical protein
MVQQQQTISTTVLSDATYRTAEESSATNRLGSRLARRHSPKIATLLKFVHLDVDENYIHGKDTAIPDGV